MVIRPNSLRHHSYNATKKPSGHDTHVRRVFLKKIRAINNGKAWHVGRYCRGQMLSYNLWFRDLRNLCVRYQAIKQQVDQTTNKQTNVHLFGLGMFKEHRHVRQQFLSSHLKELLKRLNNSFYSYCNWFLKYLQSMFCLVRHLKYNFDLI